MTFRGWDKNASAFRDVRTRRPASPFKRVAPSLSNWLVPLFSLLALSSSLPAAMFTVVNINDSGAGSLRQALLDANSNPGADSIQFNIPGSGPHTISPETDLPAITDAVTLNGYSQPGSSPNTLQNGCNAVLRIELDGGDAMDGLVFQASDCTVRGLCLNRFKTEVRFY